MSGSPPSANPDNSTNNRRPLQEKSRSHTNTLAGIRIVPYSPPRPLSITSSHRRDASTTTNAAVGPEEASAASCFSSYPPDTDRPRNGDDSRGKIAAHQPHHALATARGLDGVSGPNVPSHHRRSRGGSSGRQTALTAHTPDRAEAASPTRTGARDISQLYASSYSQLEEASCAASPGRPPSSRRRNLITVHATGRGTFAIQPQSAAAASHQSPSLSLSLSSQSSFERLSDLFSSDGGRPSTPLSTLPERTPSPCTSLESPPPSRLLGGDPIAGSSSSPWNYRLVGGLRKVPATSDRPKQNHAQSQPRPPATLFNSLLDDDDDGRLLQATPSRDDEHGDDIHPACPDSPHALIGKISFQSSQSDSTAASGETNYKVYGASSPAPANDTTVPDVDSPRAPSPSNSSSSDANYHILGRSSPAPSPPPPSPRPSPTGTIGDDLDYSLLSAPPSLRALGASAAKTRPQYSQESLVVPPLQPVKRFSFEGIGLRTSRSKESFRTGSLTSINSIFGQEAIQAFLSTPLVLRGASDASGSSGLGADPWASAPSDSDAPNPPMQAHPHLWSSQLSTVPSESEGGSEPVSRSVSPLSSSGWRSSGPPGSRHSRQMLSISSSLAAHEEDARSQSQSLSDSLERPQQTLSRGATVRLVQDHDEHGDGLAELRDFYPPLHQRPSRRRLGSLLSSSSSDRNLHSSASSRSGSLNSGSIPTWAR